MHKIKNMFFHSIVLQAGTLHDIREYNFILRV
jgi:hypothetical protein